MKEPSVYKETLKDKNEGDINHVNQHVTYLVVGNSKKWNSSNTKRLKIKAGLVVMVYEFENFQGESEEFDTCNLNQTTADAVFDLQKLRADENGKYVKSFRIHKC